MNEISKSLLPNFIAVNASTYLIKPTRARKSYTQRKQEQQAHKVNAVFYKLCLDSPTWRTATTMLHSQVLEHSCLLHPPAEEVPLEALAVNSKKLGKLLHKLAEAQRSEADAEAVLLIWSKLCTHLANMKDPYNHRDMLSSGMLSQLVTLGLHNNTDPHDWLSLVQQLLKCLSGEEVSETLWAESGLVSQIDLHLPIILGLQLRREAMSQINPIAPHIVLDSDKSERIQARLNYHGALGYPHYGHPSDDLYIRKDMHKDYSGKLITLFEQFESHLEQAWYGASEIEQNAVATSLEHLCQQAADHNLLPHLGDDELSAALASCSHHSPDEASHTSCGGYRDWLFPPHPNEANLLQLTSQAKCLWLTLCGIAELQLRSEPPHLAEQFKQSFELFQNCLRIQALNHSADDAEVAMNDCDSNGQAHNYLESIAPQANHNGDCPDQAYIMSMLEGDDPPLTITEDPYRSPMLYMVQ